MSSAPSLSIAVETPLSDDMRQMVSELNAVLRSLTPEEANFSMSVEEMTGPETTLFVARIDGAAAACGALYRHEGGIAELKRFYSRPAFQSQGLARLILDRVVELAEGEGFRELVLETGHNYEAAKRLYVGAGFEQCGPVLDYPDSEYSIFFRKPLRVAA
ncbi:GNAT family N-acetyltransferase [Roseibium sp.]|uniref:GNAT family N-acetyltransferase n=1 Tax=Roseibium sp. TaxID=1936156 RepID=UPI003B5173E6